MKYILASASPRRRELLSQAGFVFEVCPSEIEEKADESSPSDVVMKLAFQKAADVYDRYAATAGGDFTVIGADTIVVYHDEILGKPSDEAEAFDMLSMLSDRTHQVYTGVSLITCRGGAKSVNTFFESTDVTLYPISREDLLAYTQSGDPLDKAGAYGIQGPFAIHVKSISGDYINVVGLPLGRLYHELKRTAFLQE